MSRDLPSRSFAPLGLLWRVAIQSLFDSRVTLIALVGAVAAGVGFQVSNIANLRGYQAELITQGVTWGLGEVRLRPRRSALLRAE